jgi:predicted phage terminase large subunit-like protein
MAADPVDVVIRAHPGPQDAFMGCPADVALYGGAAGGGKTFAALLDQARWACSVPGFTGVIFRRTFPEIMNPGALWDESMKLFPLLGGVPRRSDTRWDWPNGSWIKFSHFQREDDIASWQGAQLAAVTFDELVHFTERQFFYMLSRLRSSCGVKPYMRATCNPDPMSWVFKLVERFIGPDGLPVQSPVTYFYRDSGKLTWSDTKDNLPADAMPRSFQFIPARVGDNPTIDPDYIGNLKALSRVDRARLLDGNWLVRASAGMFFRRGWFNVLPVAPVCQQVVRCWDRAATEQSDVSPDPDWTAGVKVGLLADGTTVILDVVRLRGTPALVQRTILATAAADGPGCEVVLSQDPGQAGVAEVDVLVKMLARFSVHVYRETGSKATRAKPLSAQCEAGNVSVVVGPWLAEFFTEVEGFVDEAEVKAPAGYHDDQVDGATGAYHWLHNRTEPRLRSLA